FPGVSSVPPRQRPPTRATAGRARPPVPRGPFPRVLAAPASVATGSSQPRGEPGNAPPGPWALSQILVGPRSADGRPPALGASCENPAAWNSGGLQDRQTSLGLPLVGAPGAVQELMQQVCVRASVPGGPHARPGGTLGRRAPREASGRPAQVVAS